MDAESSACAELPATVEAVGCAYVAESNCTFFETKKPGKLAGFF